MRFVSADRKTGKTTALVNWFLDDFENRFIIVAHGSVHADYVIRSVQNKVQKWLDSGKQVPPQLGSMKFLRDHILTSTEFRNSRIHQGRDREKTQVAVDDLEAFFIREFGCIPDVAVGSFVILSEYNLKGL